MRTPLRRLVATLALAALVASLATADDTMKGMGGAPKRVIHDVAYFKDRVLPLVQRHCVECHADGDKQNKSKNRLVPRGKDGTWTDEAVEANYKNLVRFLD